MVALVVAGTAAVESQAATFTNWETVVNNASPLPDGSGALFFSYNQPSVSAEGTVVFRARARTPRGEGEGGETGGTIQGVFTRDMAIPGAPVVTQAQTRVTLAPDPNNLEATFVAVPSFPRIDVNGAIAFRGQTQPVWEFTDPDTGESSRAGTTGVYGNLGGGLVTGASQLGFLQNFSYFAVPDTGEKLDQFPGAPSPTGSIVTFKANWTAAEDGAGMTGVLFRDVAADGGESPTRLIAKRGDLIPDEGGVPGSGATFGSTASPSASGNKVVFTGLDNEGAPTAGGVYIADLTDTPNVSKLVDFSSGVPGKAGETFNRFGEALSFDGKKASFWGAWGTQTRTVALQCRSEGNADVVAACIADSDKDPVTGEPTGRTTREVPVNQGIFTVDVATGEIDKVAVVGEDGVEEVVFWNFSGNASREGEITEEEEGPRWRSTSFAALEGDNVVFKATDATGEDALLLRTLSKPDLEVVLSTLMTGDFLDAMAPSNAFLVELGIERDSLRGGRLAINASFLNDAGDGWAGIYLSGGGTVAPVPLPAGLPLLVSALGLLALRRRRG